MIKKDNKKVRYIFRGTTPVDRAYIGSNKVFQSLQYALAYSDLPAPNILKISSNIKDVPGLVYSSKDVNLNNSPVRIDFYNNKTGYEDKDQVIRISGIDGTLTKIVFNNFDFSDFTSVSNVFAYNEQASKFLVDEIILNNCIFGGDLILKQMFAKIPKIKTLSLASSKFYKVNQMLYFIKDCDILESVDLSSLKLRITSENISKELVWKIIADCPKLKTVDISGIDADFQELLENSDKYTTTEQKRTFLDIFENCPAIEKVKVSFGFFYMIITTLNAGWLPNSSGGYKTICESLKSLPDYTYATLKSLENIEITDLDNYKNLLDG